MDATTLRTVIAVLPTPFRDAGILDLVGFARIVARSVTGGLTALTVGGNTGEFSALSPREVTELAQTAVSAANGEATIIVGAGGPLDSARFVASEARRLGAWGVMIHEPVGPFVSPEGWHRYHADIASNVPEMGIVPYLKDSRIDAARISRLIDDCPNVVAIKFAVPNPARFATIANEVGLERVVWSCGLAEMWAPTFWLHGARSFTSGLAVVEPRLATAMYERLSANDWSAALEIWHLVRPFEELRGRRDSAPNVPAIKEALAQIGVIGRTVRPPISDLSADEALEVSTILEAWGRHVTTATTSSMPATA